MMTDYKEMLMNRHRKAAEAEPLEPEKPLDNVQYANLLNTRAWRARLFAFHQGELMTEKEE
jgi:hypothetical protein